MKAVLDTNAYCLCDVGNEAGLSVLEEASSFFLPSIVYGELYYGFRHGQHFEKNMKHLEKFLSQFRVEVINVTTDVARKFGDIYASLRKKGRPIPTNDIWIAACCMEVGGTLITVDDHFREVAQIQTRFIQAS